MTQTTIRPIAPADVAQWTAIRLEALRLAPTAFSSSYEEALTMDPVILTQRIPSGDTADALFGAFAREELVGTAGFRVQTAIKMRHKGVLWGVYVRESARGAGVANALVSAVIEQARTRVAILQLAVSAHNAPARRLYDRLGFVPYGTERRALRIDGTDYDEVLMALDFGNGL